MESKDLDIEKYEDNDTQNYMFTYTDYIGDKCEKVEEDLELEWKDILAMIIAQYQIVIPWLIAYCAGMILCVYLLFEVLWA